MEFTDKRANELSVFHKKKLHLESLRGIAAITVVLYHYSLGFMNKTILQNGFTDNASLMVDFFFVLSGYVITLSYEGRILHWSEVASFQWKRFLRIYPLHLTIILLFLTLQVLKYFAGFYGIGVQKEIFDGNMSFFDFIANLFLIQNFTSAPSWNRPSWSISAEFYTYLLFAVWMMVYVRLPHFGIILASLIVGYSAFQISETSMRYATDGYFRCFMSFFIGASLYKIEKKLPIISSEVISLLVLVFTFLFIYNASYYPNWMLMLSPTLYGMLIILLNALPKNCNLIRILCMPILVFLGTISYGVYMIHDFVEALSLSLINYVFKLPLVESSDFGGRVLDINPAAVTIIEVIIIAVVIIFSSLSYKYIEMPIMRANRNSRLKEM